MLLQRPEELAELGSAMQAHWDGISLVAEELHEESTISGHRVFEILDGKGAAVAESPF